MLKIDAGLADGGPSKLVIEVLGRSATPTGAFVEFVSKKGSAEITPKHVGPGSIVYEIPIQGGDFVFESPGRGQVRWPVKSPTYLGFSVWQRLIDDGAFDVAFSDDNGRVLYRSDVFKEGSVAEADPHAEESERTIGGVRQWIVDFTAELI